MSNIYGELGQSETFTAAFTRNLSSLWERGTRTTLAGYVNGVL